MEKEIIHHDFEYYERTIEKIYKDYYKKMFILFGFFLILVGIISYLRGLKTLESLIIFLSLIEIIFIVKKYNELPLFLEKEKKISSISIFSEDVKYYIVAVESLKFKKKNSRNLPSRQKGMTFFIGTQPLNVFNPIYIRYYDMLDMTYTDRYKLNKNKVSFIKTKWKYRVKSILVGGIISIIVIFIAFGILEIREIISEKRIRSSISQNQVVKKELNFTDEQLRSGKAMFWQVIDTSRNRNLKKFYQNLNENYMTLVEEKQYLYKIYMESYLNSASNCVGLDMACKVINGYISDDTALYFYLWVISQGEDIFLNSLKDPDSLAKLEKIPFDSAVFEELAYVGVDQPVIIIPDVSDKLYKTSVLDLVEDSIVYKNGDRYGGFTDFESVMDAIPEWLPNLIERANNAHFDWKNRY